MPQHHVQNFAISLSLAAVVMLLLFVYNQTDNNAQTLVVHNTNTHAISTDKKSYEDGSCFLSFLLYDDPLSAGCKKQLLRLYFNSRYFHPSEKKDKHFRETDLRNAVRGFISRAAPAKRGHVCLFRLFTSSVTTPADADVPVRKCVNDTLDFVFAFLDADNNTK